MKKKYLLYRERPHNEMPEFIGVYTRKELKIFFRESVRIFPGKYFYHKVKERIIEGGKDEN